MKYSYLFLFIQYYKVLVKCVYKGEQSCIGLCVLLKCTWCAYYLEYKCNWKHFNVATKTSAGS